MSKIVLTDVSSGFQLSKINENFQKIEDELNNKVLYRDAPTGEPNALENDLDANGKWILNVAGITLEGSQDLSEIVEEVAAIKVEIDATALEVEADKDAAQQALDDVVATKSEFDKLYLGSKSSDPTVDNEGAALQEGSFYFNTSLSPKRLRVYNGVGWIDSVGYEVTTTTSIDAVLYASQAEAEAGVNNTKVVTPLRTHQAATVVATSVATDLIADAVADYIPLTGGVLSGTLTLSGTPTENMHAANKQYVDTQVESISVVVPDASETVKGIVEIATSAEAVAFTANKIIDGEKLALAFKSTNQLLSPTGKQILPGGLQFRWGSCSTLTGNNGADVTFATQFPVAALHAFVTAVTASDSAAPVVCYRNLSKTGMRISNGTTETAESVSYFVIGY